MANVPIANASAVVVPRTSNNEGGLTNIFFIVSVMIFCISTTLVIIIIIIMIMIMIVVVVESSMIDTTRECDRDWWTTKFILTLQYVEVDVMMMLISSLDHHSILEKTLLCFRW